MAAEAHAARQMCSKLTLTRDANARRSMGRFAA
jgi:hypothetical protein